MPHFVFRFVDFDGTDFCPSLFDYRTRQDLAVMAQIEKFIGDSWLQHAQAAGNTLEAAQALRVEVERQTTALVAARQIDRAETVVVEAPVRRGAPDTPCLLVRVIRTRATYCMETRFWLADPGPAPHRVDVALPDLDRDDVAVAVLDTLKHYLKPGLQPDKATPLLRDFDAALTGLIAKHRLDTDPHAFATLPESTR